MNEAVIRAAFVELFPDKDANKYNFSIKYSGHFKDYGANVKMLGNYIDFHLSKKWKAVSREIQIGLLQELLMKIFNTKKKNTINVDLYNHFVKKLHIAVLKEKPEPKLEESFNRVNEKYFNGMLEMPNIKWGAESANQLGAYEYANDTIIVSSLLKNADEDILDYIMYHEMLHKKLKYRHKNGRARYHTSKFRKMEKLFENQDVIEKKLQRLRKPRIVRPRIVRRNRWF